MKFSDNEVGVLTVLENTCLKHNVLAQHGVSFWISYYGKKYLFDCGQIFIGLQYNLGVMNIDIDELEAIIISHGHGDHCGSLIELTNLLKKQKIYVTPDIDFLKLKQFKEKYRYKNINFDSDFQGGISFDIAKLEEYENLVKVNSVLELEKGLYLTGPLGGKILEQSLVMDLGFDGIFILVGCSHPSLKTIISKAQEITGNQKIMGVMGGFHLVESDDQKIQETIDYLKSLDLGFLVPGHCTGSNAVNMMKEQLGDKLKISDMGSIGVANYVKLSPELKISLV